MKVAAPNTKPKAMSSARKAPIRYVDSAQLDLFGDDALVVDTIIDNMEAAEDAVIAALDANPSILPEGPDAADARDTLDLARFMRTNGTPVAVVREILTGAGANADVVMERLAKVEEVVGADYPEVELNDLQEIGDEDRAESQDEDAEDDSTDNVAKKFDHVSAASENALSALMKRVRGKRYEPMTQERETELSVLIRAGDEKAKTELIERNMRFLISQARRFMYTGRSYADLISFGCKGLIVAAGKFDPERGRFTTCAAQWIRQSIQRELQADGLMRTPAYMQPRANKLRREAAECPEGEERDVKIEKAERLEAEIKGRRASAISMDGGQDDDSDSGGGLHNMFESECEGPDEMMEKRRLVAQLVKTANGLEDSRSRDVFLMRVGLHPDHFGDSKTLQEVSEVFDVSRERIRQIYAEAALEVSTNVMIWAKGEDSLPAGFRKGIMSPGRN